MKGDIGLFGTHVFILSVNISLILPEVMIKFKQS